MLARYGVILVCLIGLMTCGPSSDDEPKTGDMEQIVRTDWGSCGVVDSEARIRGNPIDVDVVVAMWRQSASEVDFKEGQIDIRVTNAICVDRSQALESEQPDWCGHGDWRYTANLNDLDPMRVKLKDNILTLSCKSGDCWSKQERQRRTDAVDPSQSDFVSMVEELSFLGEFEAEDTGTMGMIEVEFNCGEVPQRRLKGALTRLILMNQ